MNRYQHGQEHGIFALLAETVPIKLVLYTCTTIVSSFTFVNNFINIHILDTFLRQLCLNAKVFFYVD